MIMVDTIEEAIYQATEDNDKANQTLSTLAKGCDEYLDKAIEQTNRFVTITSKLRQLNGDTIVAFNNDQEEAYSLLPSMQTLLDACKRNLVALKESELADALGSVVRDFQDEADQLKENINDFILIHDKMPQDEELQSLLSQL